MGLDDTRLLENFGFDSGDGLDVLDFFDGTAADKLDNIKRSADNATEVASGTIHVLRVLYFSATEADQNKIRLLIQDAGLDWDYVLYAEEG